MTDDVRASRQRRADDDTLYCLTARPASIPIGSLKRDTSKSSSQTVASSIRRFYQQLTPLARWECLWSPAPQGDRSSKG
jgi:hypothetical protein